MKNEDIEKKERIIELIKKVINQPCSTLDTKFEHSHDKVSVVYKKHRVEIVGGEEKFIKFVDTKIILKKKEYKSIMDSFNNELKIRKDKKNADKFNDLEKDLNTEL